jgi:hypothetical protein
MIEWIDYKRIDIEETIQYIIISNKISNKLFYMKIDLKNFIRFKDFIENGIEL